MGIWQAIGFPDHSNLLEIPWQQPRNFAKSQILQRRRRDAKGVPKVDVDSYVSFGRAKAKINSMPTEPKPKAKT